MHFKIGSANGEEGLQDCCLGSYRDADPSDLGTLVFVKCIEDDIGDRVVVYTHFDGKDDSFKEGMKLKIIGVCIFLSMFTLIIISFRSC